MKWVSEERITRKTIHITFRIQIVTSSFLSGLIAGYAISDSKMSRNAINLVAKCTEVFKINVLVVTETWGSLLDKRYNSSRHITNSFAWCKNHGAFSMVLAQLCS